MKTVCNEPFLWLQPYETNAVADCGCLLEITDVGPRFVMCQMHASAPVLHAAASRLLEDALDRGECHDEDTGEIFDDWRELKIALAAVSVIPK